MDVMSEQTADAKSQAPNPTPAPTMAELYEAQRAEHQERISKLTAPTNLQPGDAARYVGPTAFSPKADIIGKFVRIEGDTAFVAPPPKKNAVGVEIQRPPMKIDARWIEKA